MIQLRRIIEMIQFQTNHLIQKSVTLKVATLETQTQNLMTLSQLKDSDYQILAK